MTPVSTALADMRQRGVNPSSPGYSGLRARTQAATASREASFEKLLNMISEGRRQAFSQPGVVPNAFAGTRTVGPAGQGVQGVQRVGEVAPGVRQVGQDAPGVQRIGEVAPGVRQIGQIAPGVVDRTGVLGLTPRQLREHNLGRQVAIAPQPQVVVAPQQAFAAVAAPQAQAAVAPQRPDAFIPAVATRGVSQPAEDVRTGIFVNGIEVTRKPTGIYVGGKPWSAEGGSGKSFAYPTRKVYAKPEVSEFDHLK